MLIYERWSLEIVHTGATRFTPGDVKAAEAAASEVRFTHHVTDTHTAFAVFH
jgi:hypothetical protein